MANINKPLVVLDYSRAFLAKFLPLLVLLVLISCSSTTEPPPAANDLAFTHSPNSLVVVISQGEGVEFSLSSSPPVALEYYWTLNGAPTSKERSYQFNSTQVGLDTLRLVYTYDSVQWNRTWYINTQTDPTTAPGRVPGVQLSHGPEAGDVVMSWFWIAQSAFPVINYRIAVSYDGPINAFNWADAEFLVEVPHVDQQVGYSQTFSMEENQILPGVDAWFGIRGVDETGQMSPLNEVQYHKVSFPWWISGHVFSDQLVPLDGVIIDYGCTSCRVNTDGTGFFSIGPLSSVLSYDLKTISRNIDFPGVPLSSWYDFWLHGVQFEPETNQDLVLVTRYDLNGNCFVHDQEFLNYFRQMTSTRQPSNHRPNTKLFKWAEYPISVYVAPFTGTYGHDYQALCQEVVGFWNLAMGEEYLVLVDNPEDARIEVFFDNEDHIFFGSTDLILPNDQNFSLGEAIPEKMTIFLVGTLREAITIQEICMHEFGHALGLSAHNFCTGGGYLMSIDPGGSLDNGPENAVHPFEKAAIRAIRNLPQGIEMSDFQLD